MCVTFTIYTFVSLTSTLTQTAFCLHLLFICSHSTHYESTRNWSDSISCKWRQRLLYQCIRHLNKQYKYIITQLSLTILLSGSNIPDKDDTNTDPDTDTNKEEDKEDSGNNSEYELSECAKNTRDCNLDTDCKKVEFMLF